MRKNEKKSIFSLGPNGPILQIFLVVQYLVGSLKIPSDGSNNLIFLDQAKRHCVPSSFYLVSLHLWAVCCHQFWDNFFYFLFCPFFKYESSLQLLMVSFLFFSLSDFIIYRFVMQPEIQLLPMTMKENSSTLK